VGPGGRKRAGPPHLALDEGGPLLVQRQPAHLELLLLVLEGPAVHAKGVHRRQGLGQADEVLLLLLVGPHKARRLLVVLLAGAAPRAHQQASGVLQAEGAAWGAWVAVVVVVVGAVWVVGAQSRGVGASSGLRVQLYEGCMLQRVSGAQLAGSHAAACVWWCAHAFAFVFVRSGRTNCRPALCCSIYPFLTLLFSRLPPAHLL